MGDEEHLDQSTIPKDIVRFIEVDDLTSLSSAVAIFRQVMDKFMELENVIQLFHRERSNKMKWVRNWNLKTNYY